MTQDKITPAVLIWQDTLKEVPLFEFDGNNKNEGSLRYHEDKLKEVVGYRWANSHQYLQIQSGGYYFAFAINYCPHLHPKKNFHWNVQVWDMTGQNTVGCYKFPAENKETDVMPKEVWRTIIDDCENYVKDILKCSGCQTKIKKSEIAGHYFAGQYCSVCWDNKYKAIEAAESYN